MSSEVCRMFMILKLFCDIQIRQVLFSMKLWLIRLTRIGQQLAFDFFFKTLKESLRNYENLSKTLLQT